LLCNIGINLGICSPNALGRGELPQYDNNNCGGICCILWIFWEFILSGQLEAIPGYEAYTHQKGADQASLILWDRRDRLSWNKVVPDVLFSGNRN